MEFPRDPNSVLLAKQFRKNMTSQERHLWYAFLRNYPVRFRRQEVIDRYIADFYCAKARLIIEVDGSQHYSMDGWEYDKIRTDFFNNMEISVLRFSNRQVDREFPAVCQTIHRTVQNRIALLYT